MPIEFFKAATQEFTPCHIFPFKLVASLLYADTYCIHSHINFSLNAICANKNNKRRNIKFSAIINKEEPEICTSYCSSYNSGSTTCVSLPNVVRS